MQYYPNVRFLKWLSLKYHVLSSFQNNLILHLDGARLYNAIVAKKESPKQYGELFDSISVCLSKGLGTPVGSVLIGKKEMIKKARRIMSIASQMIIIMQNC